MIYITSTNSLGENTIIEAVSTNRVANILVNKYARQSTKEILFRYYPIHEVIDPKNQRYPKITIPDRFRKLVATDWKYVEAKIQ